MGSSSGVTRGQLRPFSGRSPPFLVAALFVGLGILGVSYWSLSTQYSDLEDQLRKALQRKETLENDENFVQNQLHLREEEFSRAKVTLQKKEQEIIQLNNQLKSLGDELDAANQFNMKCKDELNKKDNEIGDIKTKLKDVQDNKEVIVASKGELEKQLQTFQSNISLLLKENTELRKQISTRNDSELQGSPNEQMKSFDHPAPENNPPVETNLIQQDKKTGENDTVTTNVKQLQSENKDTNHNKGNDEKSNGTNLESPAELAADDINADGILDPPADTNEN